MAQVGAAHCPFVAGVSPSVMPMETWQELANPRDLTRIFGTPEYAPWRSLRDSEDARYIGLGMPRFLGRYPSGKANPVEEFDFQEDTEGARHEKFIAAFIGAQALQKPAEYTDPDATATANLSARLPFLFAACRFAHDLKCIVRDKVGSFRERDDVQMWLNNWISQYVLSNPASAGRGDRGQSRWRRPR